MKTWSSGGLGQAEEYFEQPLAVKKNVVFFG